MNLAELTWIDAKEAIKQARVALLPVGSTENHGPHLPLGTDWFTAQRIAEETEKKGGWLMLPSVPVGVSEHHRQFWGTLWVSPDVLRGYVVAVARAVASHGLRRIVFVNGHGGNRSALVEAARLLREEGIYAYVHNWWYSITDLLEKLFPEPAAHAGPVETSAILAIDPELVRQDRYNATSEVGHWGKTVEGVDIGWDTIDFSDAGNVGDPSTGTAEKGAQVFEAASESLNRFCTWLAEQSEESLSPKPHKP